MNFGSVETPQALAYYWKFHKLFAVVIMFGQHWTAFDWAVREQVTDLSGLRASTFAYPRQPSFILIGPIINMPGPGRSCFVFYRASRFKFITHRNSSIWRMPVNSGVCEENSLETLFRMAGTNYLIICQRTKESRFEGSYWLDKLSSGWNNNIFRNSTPFSFHSTSDQNWLLIWPELSRAEQTTAKCHLAVWLRNK